MAAASIIAPMNVLIRRVLFMISSPFLEIHTANYCSSSPASENAPLALETDAPQTTLEAEVLVPVLDPQTTLNALRVLSLQGIELPHTTELPFTIAVPQTTEVPQTTDVPQTTELEATVEFPYDKRDRMRLRVVDRSGRKRRTDRGRSQIRVGNRSSGRSVIPTPPRTDRRNR